ncbi:mitochondrial ribosomal protein L40 [Oratosquilla oratoria]|uniref:mitochondrial ribosomal protein L40 n=1 Tax=Oratosquilla oratoria TaxID=337810 RepID=UPI003F76DC3B
MISRSKIFASLSRLQLSVLTGERSLTTASGPLCFYASPVVAAEPLKKKKRIDPQVLKQREERKKRRIEKSIRRLEKHASQLKPIEELEAGATLAREKGFRERDQVNLNEPEEETRIALMKEWSRYKFKQQLEELVMIERVMAAREKALEELRKESEELYLEAIQIDPSLLPFRVKGPVATPPIEGYDAPDGEYIDVTRKWE